MKIKEIGIILTPTFRAMAYLQRLISNGLYPNFAIVLKGDNADFLEKINKNNDLNLFDEFVDFKASLDKHEIEYQEIDSIDCNDKEVIDAVKNRNEGYFIFTGGGILKEDILNLDKKFIHVHPGIVPQYRGSTCMYYSIIKEGNCGATAFFMSKKIDEGDIISKKQFEKPNTDNIDYAYDCHMRSSLLVDIMKQYTKEGKFNLEPQNPDEGEAYFIIHPVLKHLAILSCKR